MVTMGSALLRCSPPAILLRRRSSDAQLCPGTLNRAFLNIRGLPVVSSSSERPENANQRTDNGDLDFAVFQFTLGG